jgi:TolB-like protein/class 3 adenylate cyclase
MYTDIVGYTALTQSDEEQTLAVLERHNRLLRPIFPRFHGREVKAIGDSFLVEFESALDATNCAVEVQRLLHDYNISSRDEWKITLRIGIHLGDVVRSGSDILGDAVNIASRLQPLAEPEGVCISEQVYDQVRNKVPQALVKLEPHDLKGVRFQVDVYKVVMPWEHQSSTKETALLPRDRIAILPFANMSPDPNDEYFADSITDEIITTVSGISGLSVISRTSAMVYKGASKRLGEIGRELGVGSILEGSFKKAGNRIRVTTQLIDVAADKHLWAQNYDRNLDDVFEVQSDVAKQVAEALRVRILAPERERIEKKPTESTSAYAIYLRGRYYWNLRGMGSGGASRENLKNALMCFEQAVAEDPRFALGYVGEADCCVALRDNYGVEREANMQRAKEMVDKALELDPDLAEVHATRGLVLEREFRFKDAESELRKAIELKPSYAVAHYWYYGLLLSELRWEEAREQLEKALELDPLSPVFNGSLPWLYFFKRDYGKALELFKKGIELGLPQRQMVAHIYGMMKNHDEVRREWAAWVELQQSSWPFARKWADFYIAYFENDRERCRRLLPELESHFGKEMELPAIYVAHAYFCAGENDKGFDWLERSYSRREAGLVEMRLWPELDGIRNDPRYLDLLKRLGLD